MEEAQTTSGELDQEEDHRSPTPTADDPPRLPAELGKDPASPKVIDPPAEATETTSATDRLGPVRENTGFSYTGDPSIITTVPIYAPGPNGDSSIPFPSLDEDPALFSGDGDDHWAQNFDPSQIDDDSNAASEDYQIQAFAKLEFDDGEFYMNTYAVELGRDIRAARDAIDRREREVRESREPMSRKRSRSNGQASDTSSKAKKRQRKTHAGSIVSDIGGVIGVDEEEPVAMDEKNKTKRTKPKSTSSSSQQLSRKSSMHQMKQDYNALTLQKAFDDNPEELEGAGGSLDWVPLIPIHPPTSTNGDLVANQGISRKHIRIAFNFEQHMFEVTFIGRNGGFVDDVWYAPDAVVTLVSGSIIQLRGIRIKFVLPDVPEGETGAEHGIGSDPLSGGKLSFDMADSDELDENEYGFEYGEDPAAVEGEEEPEGTLTRRRAGGREKIELEPEIEPQKPRRKGPGRPPKDGIMSKREKAQQAKQSRENAKAKVDAKGKPATGRGKGKTAKALTLEESSLQPNGKRKYTKRKRAGGEADDRVRESTEQDDSLTPERPTVKTAKEKKPLKPPRSPSPVFNEAELTAEQLAKPQHSYVVLIHEALSNCPTGQMSLPQIYRAIERRYPWFKLKVQTNGWQSSVRHNLSQHLAFKKIERDGKGWMWGLVPEVSIEKEKKRRPSPPATPQQNYNYPPQQARYPQHTVPWTNAMQAPVKGHIPPYPPFGMPMPYPPARGPVGFPLPFVAPSESTYQSPYASGSAPTPATAAAAAAQTVTKENGVNGHYPTPNSQSASQQPQDATKNPPAESPSPAPNGTTQPPSAPSAATRNHSDEVLNAVTRFKAALIDSMDDKTHAEKLVSAAVDRTLGKTSSTGQATPDEKAIMTALDSVLADVEKKRNVNASLEISSNGGDAAVSVQGSTVAEKAADIARKIQGEKGEAAA